MCEVAGFSSVMLDALGMLGMLEDAWGKLKKEEKANEEDK